MAPVGETLTLQVLLVLHVAVPDITVTLIVQRLGSPAAMPQTSLVVLSSLNTLVPSEGIPPLHLLGLELALALGSASLPGLHHL